MYSISCKHGRNVFFEFAPPQILNFIPDFIYSTLVDGEVGNKDKINLISLFLEFPPLTRLEYYM